MACVDTLVNIVGLTDRASICFDNEPSGYDTSLSGFYLTDTEFGVDIQQAWAARSKDDTEVWDTLTRAREQAIKDFEVELALAIAKYKKPRLSPFYGTIGKNEVGMTLTPQGDLIGMKLCPIKYKGSYLRIEQIGIALGNTASDIDVKVYKVCDDYVFPDAVAETTINSSANVMNYNTLDTAIELPLWDEDCDDLEYRIYVNIPSGSVVKKTRFKCCSRRETWMDYLTPKGISANSYTGEPIDNISDSYGISLKGRLQCKGLDWLCKDLNEFQGYDLFKVAARAIQCSGAAKLCVAILETTNVNAWTLLSREALAAKLQQLQDYFMQNVDTLAQGLPDNATDCYVCKETKFTKRQILV